MKRTFVLGLAVLFFSGLFIVTCQNDIETAEGNFTRSASSEICKINKSTGFYDENIGKSWAAWEEARVHFFIEYYEYTSTLGTYTKQKWTDDFGGVYINENGIVNILVVGNRMPVKSDYLIYKKVNNSYNFLDSIYVEISESMDKFGIWQAGVCELCNKVLVCLESEKEINTLINHLKTNNLFKRNTLKIFVEKHEWNFGYTKKYNSGIMYRDNVELYDEASMSEKFWIKNDHLFENIFDRLRAENFSNIIIFKSEEELPGITIEGLNIDREYFEDHLLGMVMVPWGGGMQLRNSKVYNENEYLAFSVDIWMWSGISTSEVRNSIFFLKIPKY